jgi:hypothetical protein
VRRTDPMTENTAAALVPCIYRTHKHKQQP